MAPILDDGAMRIWSIVVLVVSPLVAACGKTSSPTPEGSGSGTVTTGGDHGGSSGSVAPANDAFDKALTALDALKAKMCACQDNLCTGKVLEEYTTWRGDMRKAVVGTKPTKAQDDRGKALDKEFRACRTAIAAKAATGSAMQPTGSAAGDPFDNALVDLEAFKTRMCACKDKPCADRIQADISAWRRAFSSRTGTAKPTTLQDARGKAIDKEVKACRQTAEAGTGSATAGDKIDAVIAKMAMFKDGVCACKDKPCAEKVKTELVAWQKTLEKELADAKPTKDQDAKFDQLDKAFAACVDKLR